MMIRIFKNIRKFSSFSENIMNEYTNRYKQGIPPLPLNVEQVSELCNLLENPKDEDNTFLYKQFTERIVPGVDDTTLLKATFLNNICSDKIKSPIINKVQAIKILGTMQGGYNVDILINLLDDEQYGIYACNELSNLILVFDSYYKVEEKAKSGNIYAVKTIENWANATWFTKRDKMPEIINTTIFKVDGEINTDDLSPAQDAWSRPDIPLHSLAMLKTPREDIDPDIPYEIGPITLINNMKKNYDHISFTGDIVGTGSSRKSATNSLLWHFGEAIPYVPNKKSGGICIGNKIAPIFFNTMEDSGALPIEMNVDKLHMGDEISIYPYERIVTDNHNNILTNFNIKSDILYDSVQAGGRINLIIGKSLTSKAQNFFRDDERIFFWNDIFKKNKVKKKNNKNKNEIFNYLNFHTLPQYI